MLVYHYVKIKKFIHNGFICQVIRKGKAKIKK